MDLFSIFLGLGWVDVQFVILNRLEEQLALGHRARPVALLLLELLFGLVVLLVELAQAPLHALR